MKKVYSLLFAVLFFAGLAVNGQSTANYTFATDVIGSLAADRNGNTVDMTTGTTQLVAPSSDATVSAVTSIGFDFFLYGNRYAQFSASADGMVGLGSIAVSGTTNGAASTATPKISAMGGDLYVGASGKVHYKLVGTAPNRCLVVEFKNMAVFYSTTAGNAINNYQVRLYESTGIIEFVYGTMYCGSTTYAPGYVGFSVGSVVNTNASVTTSSNTVSYAATFASNTYTAATSIPNLNTTSDPNRRRYTFIPPGNTSHATIKTLAAPTGLTYSNVTNSSVTLNWTAASPTTGILAYPIYLSGDGGVTYAYLGQVAVGTNTVNVTGLLPNTTYFFRVYSVSEGYLSTALTGSQATAACPTGAQTFTINNTLPLSTTNFPSFTSAINYLNGLSGCSLGGNYTFNVSAGQTFTESTPALTASGTSGAQIIFQKSGAGANPILSAPGSTGTETAIFINGGDYITFDGIDIATATATLEYGYYIQNVSATNGAQNNTIRNCTITLNRTNGASIGIIQTYNIVPTSAAGANSNNKYYNLVIKNNNQGVLLQGYTGFPDVGCEVGTTSCSLRNTIGDPSTTDDIIYTGAAGGNIGGITASNQSGVKIFNNDISNISTSTNNSTIDGIFIDNLSATVALGTSDVYNNKINAITHKSTAANANAVVRGIRVNGNAFAATITRVYNNFISNLQTGSTNTTLTTRRVIGLSLQPAGTGGGSSIFAEFNSVNISVTNLAVSNASLEIGVASGPIFKVRNNILSNFTAAQSGGAKHYSWVTTSATAIGPTGSVSNYNDLYVTGTNGFVGLGNATDYATLANWQAATSNDANSVSVDPQFASSTDLHASAAALNGTADPAYATNTPYVTIDIDCTTRPAATDIGADEFTSTACTTPSSPAAVTLGNSTVSTQAGTITAPATPPTGYIVISSTNATAPPLTNGITYAQGSTQGAYTVQYNGTGTTFTASTNLISNTRYYYYVYSYNSACTGQPYYSVTPVMANKYTCIAAPTAPVTGTVTSSGATISWTAPAGTITSYTINYGTATGTYTLSTTSATNSVTLTGLNPNQSYYYVVVANNTANNSTCGTASPASAEGTFTTTPVNDLCSGAIVIPSTSFPVLTTTASNANATTTGDPAPSCQGTFNKGIWYSFTPATTGSYTFSTCPALAPGAAALDNILGIYTGTCGGTYTSVACNDDGLAALCSSATANAVISSVALNAGTTYYVVASTYGATGGNIQIYVNYIPPPTITSFASSQCVGTSLVITGTNLSGATSVTIGATAATITANTSTSVTVTVPAAASGTITFTGTNGTVTSTSTFTSNPLPTAAWASAAAAACSSSSAQTTTLAYTSTTNAPTSYSITWSATPANSFAAVTDATFAGTPTGGSINISIPAATAAGTYTGTITVKNADGCVSTPAQTFTVTVNAPPSTVTVTPATSTICANGSAQALTASGGASSETPLFDGFETYPSANFLANGTGVTVASNSTYYKSGAKSVLVKQTSATTTLTTTGTNNSYVQQNNVSLSGATAAQLSFSHICALEGSGTTYDAGYIQYSADGGVTWTTFPTSSYAGTGTLITNINGTTVTGAIFSTKSYSDWTSTFTSSTATPGTGPAASLWKTETFNVPAAALTSAQFRVRFLITADNAVAYYGWLIDNVTINATRSGTATWTTNTTGLFADAALTVPYTSQAQNTVYARPATSQTYTATVTSGSTGCKTSADAVVTVSQPSVAPTDLQANGSEGTLICNTGSQTVTLTQTGGTLGTGATWRWYSNASFTTLVGSSTAANASLTLATGTPTATTTYYLRAEGTASPCISTVGNSTPNVTVTVGASGEWVGGPTGDWNTPSNWCGGVPTSASNVVVPAGVNITIGTADAFANSVTINGTLTTTGVYNLTISGNGYINNNGTLSASTSTGAIIFAGSGSVSGTIVLHNVRLNGAVNFGAASTIGAGGSLVLNNGSYVDTNAPAYDCTSTLVYNAGGVYSRGAEWSSATSGKGYPGNVTLSSNTTLNYPNGSVAGHSICGTLSIDNGSSLYMDYSGTNPTAALAVGGNLTLNGDLRLSGAAGGDLKLAGNWVRTATGSFNANNRAVFFNGNISATINGSGGQIFEYAYLNKTAGSLSLASPVRINQEIGLVSGTFDPAKFNITIRSDAAATARIAPVSASVNYSDTGRFIIERYIGVGNPGFGRKWEFVSAPVQSEKSIFETFQENGLTTPGYGTVITGPGGGNGLDSTSPGPSIKYYTPGPAFDSWTGVTNTLTTPISNPLGFMTFVRGDRTIRPSGTAASSTTLRSNGKIFDNATLPPSVSVDAGKFQGVGNPYASAIDFTALTKTNIDNTIFVWDPYLTGSYNTGAYVTISRANGWQATPTTARYPDSTANKQIQSGQAVIVRNSSASTGSVAFTEAAKVAGSRLVNRGNNITNTMFFRVDLYNSTGNVADGNATVFDTQYSNNVDGDDAYKIINGGLNFCLKRNGILLAVEARQPLSTGDSVLFYSSGFPEGNYEIRFGPQGMAGAPFTAELIDKWQNTVTMLSLSDTSKVNISVTSDPLSKVADRWMVVFKPTSPLPVTFVSVAAIRNADRSIAVSWKVANEINIEKYTVERSADGRVFSSILTNGVEGVSSYSKNDLSPLSADNYYRIKATGINGQVQYSPTVKVAPLKGQGFITVYPNPVTDKTVNVVFTNEDNGTYKLQLTDKLGKVVYTGKAEVTGSGFAKGVELNRTIAAGVYQLQVTSPENKSAAIIQVIIQ